MSPEETVHIDLGVGPIPEDAQLGPGLARSDDFTPPQNPRLDEGLSLRDPDGDGRPGISWQSVVVIVAVLATAGLLSWQGAIDLGRLLELGLAGGGLLGASKLRS